MNKKYSMHLYRVIFNLQMFMQTICRKIFYICKVNWFKGNNSCDIIQRKVTRVLYWNRISYLLSNDDKFENNYRLAE